MKRAQLQQENRIMRFEELYHKRLEKRLTIEQAAEVLGVNERTFRRYVNSYEAEGKDGLMDSRLGKAAHNTAPVDEVLSMTSLFEEKFSDYSVSHFYDKWRSDHRGNRSYGWVNYHLQKAGHVRKAKKRGIHRQKRERRPMRGMMLHQDGSTHLWVPGKYWDLIVTMDDATGEIYSALFVEEEGTWSSFEGVSEVIEQHGLFCTLYTDRGSHYWTTPHAGGKVDKQNLTQFGRAMKHLGIEMIPAYSPEARGRSERMFGTLQARLPKELRDTGITEMEAANEFLKETFLPAFNQRFSQPPQESESAFIPWIEGNTALSDILCIREKRTVVKDNTVSYRGKKYQIPADRYRHHYVKAEVELHEYEDGRVSLFHGPRKLACYDVDGKLESNEPLEASNLTEIDRKSQ